MKLAKLTDEEMVVIAITCLPWVLLAGSGTTNGTTYVDGPHCEKLIIPRDAKPELLRELQLMNVTEKSKFPGLDGLGRTRAEPTQLSVRFGTVTPPNRRQDRDRPQPVTQLYREDFQSADTEIASPVTRGTSAPALPP